MLLLFKCLGCGIRVMCRVNWSSFWEAIEIKSRSLGNDKRRICDLKIRWWRLKSIRKWNWLEEVVDETEVSSFWWIKVDFREVLKFVWLELMGNQFHFHWHFQQVFFALTFSFIIHNLSICLCSSTKTYTHHPPAFLWPRPPAHQRVHTRLAALPSYHLLCRRHRTQHTHQLWRLHRFL